MDAPDIIAVLRRFEVGANRALTVEQLSGMLDELAAAVQACPPGVYSDVELEPPKQSVPSLDELRTRMPYLGWYPVVDPLMDHAAAATLADAADDLADIVAEVREVLWRNDKLGSLDAFWWLEFMFARHWGRHLRNLSSYLHAIQFEGVRIGASNP